MLKNPRDGITPEQAGVRGPVLVMGAGAIGCFIGGRLAAIVGELPIMRARLFTRVTQDSWSDVDLFDTVAQRLSGFMADFYGAYLDDRLDVALKAVKG